MSTQPLKLYHVEVEFSYYVAARGEAEARMAARYFMRDAMLDGDSAPWPSEVKDIKHLEDEWRDEIPYAEHDVNPRDLTCAQIMDPAAPAKPDEGIGPVVWCHGCSYERVQFDWRLESQLCAKCREGATADPALQRAS